jgi:hypothetical protein
MERLYYDPPRVNKNAVPSKMGINDYLNKVATLVPAEIIAGYLTMFGLVSSIRNIGTQIIFYWIVFAAGVILTPFYMNQVATVNKPKIIHIIISTLAFVVWAYVTTGKVLSETIAFSFDQAVASILLILFSLISSLIPLNK